MASAQCVKSQGPTSFVALKVREVDGQTASKICIFDAEDAAASFGCSEEFFPIKV